MICSVNLDMRYFACVAFKDDSVTSLLCSLVGLYCRFDMHLSVRRSSLRMPERSCGVFCYLDDLSGVLCSIIMVVQVYR